MNATSPHHLTQRLRVGAIGLAVVVVLIVVAGTVQGAVSRQRSATLAGTRAEIAQSLARGNAAEAEPLHDMGIAPAAEGKPTRR